MFLILAATAIVVGVIFRYLHNLERLREINLSYRRTLLRNLIFSSRHLYNPYNPYIKNDILIYIVQAIYNEFGAEHTSLLMKCSYLENELNALDSMRFEGGELDPLAYSTKARALGDDLVTEIEKVIATPSYNRSVTAKNADKNGVHSLKSATVWSLLTVLYY